MEPFTSDFGSLCFHKKSMRGKCYDYKITFHKTQHNPELLVDKVLELIECLFVQFNGKRIWTRLIATVWFEHINDIQNVVTKDNELFAFIPSRRNN